MRQEHMSSVDVLKRLSKVEGHIRGIKKMIENEKECEDVLLQIAAVQAALSKAARLLFEDHFQHCIIERTNDAAFRRELVKFKDAMATFSKGIS